MGRVACASLVGAVVVATACGSFSAAEERAGSTDGGETGDAARSDATPGDGDGGGKRDGGDAESRKCLTKATFSDPVPVAAPFAQDVRALRVRGDAYFFSHAPGGVGVELGAAERLPDAGVGAIHGGWFGSANGVGGQTLPAVSANALVVIYQDDGSAKLRRVQRPGRADNFGSPTDVDMAPTTFDSDLVEPYLTATDDLYFATAESNLAFHATLTSDAVTFDRELVELGTASFPVVSDDGLEIFFMRSAGVQTVFHATRSSPSAMFGAPEALLQVATVEQNTRPTWISPDGCTLFLIRSGGASNDAPFSLYVARRN